MAHQKTKLRKGDKVVVLSGKEKGATGTVQQVLAKSGKVIVEGTYEHPFTNEVRPIGGQKRHTKTRSANQPGGILDKVHGIDMSRVALLASDGRPVRIGFRVNDDGTKTRIGRRGGQEIEL